VSAPAVVWFRRDLRVHDHPALALAVREHERVVPVFVLDDTLIHGRHPSGNRTAFLLGCLRDLDGALRRRGGRLVVRRGHPAAALLEVARAAGAERVLYSSDVSPFARSREAAVIDALRPAGVEPVAMPGCFATDVGAATTRDGRPFQVFSPFHRAWRELPRRPVEPAPDEVRLPADIAPGSLPALAELGLESEAVPEHEPGESAARPAMERWLAEGVGDYDRSRQRLAGGTSRLSPHLHFGCLSARELEARVGARSGRGREAFRRQLAWRDFYGHVLLAHPENARTAFREPYRALEVDENPERFEAWAEGRTGFPLVDAGMRQLRATGWMPNRARLVVASFLTKDLHLDWRLGEAHFMRHLIDGDEASNNGNWQWIAGVGVDPAPVHRRLYNPARHQERYDPGGEYVRHWVPELGRVPLERLPDPAGMPRAEQEAYGCVIGRDYPAPMVHHPSERREALERYGRVREATPRG
jgi:deoxyribodipyrimidine photo-lyase